MSAVETSTEVMDEDHCPDDEPALTPPGQAAADTTSAGEDSTVTGSDSSRPRRHRSWASFFGYRVMPAIVLLLAFGAGYLKYGDAWAGGADSRTHRIRVKQRKTVPSRCFRTRRTRSKPR